MPILDDPTKNTFLGVPMLQLWSDLFLWERFFQNYPIKSLVELGAYKAGFSLFLLAQCTQRGIHFRTNDLKPIPNDSLVGTLLGLDRRFSQCSYTDPSFVQMVRGMPKPLLLFCDDGDKPSEVKFWKSELDYGDFMAAHDWNGEIRQSDIPPGLEPIMEKEAIETSSWTRWWQVM